MNTPSDKTKTASELVKSAETTAAEVVKTAAETAATIVKTAAETAATANSSVATDIGWIKNDIREIKMTIKEAAGTYITKIEFEPIKKVVYGLVTLILTAVVIGMLALVIKGTK